MWRRSPFLWVVVLTWVQVGSPVQAALSGAVVFVGNNNIDLKWDISSSLQCDGYILRRDSSEFTFDSTVSFFRDESVTKGQTYTYSWAYIKDTNVFWTAPVKVMAGEVEGRIYSDLIWPTDTYVIHGAVDVEAGCTLTVQSRAQLIYPKDSTEGRLGASSLGNIQIEGATVGVQVFFLTDTCAVENSTFAGTSLSNRSAQLVINADQTVTGCVFSNSVIEVEGTVPDAGPSARNAHVLLENNRLTNVLVMCRGRSLLDMTQHRQADRVDIIASEEATLNLVGNSIQNAMISLRGNASATIASNVLKNGTLYTWARANLVVERNVLETTNRQSGSAITLALWDMYQDGPDFNARIQHNLIMGSDLGQGYGYGISFRSSDVKIPGQTDLSGNTVRQCNVAILVEGDSAVLINNNCLVDCGDYGAGLTVRKRSEMLDASRNWWGDGSGPRHLGNPGGLGTSITGDSDYMVWFVPYKTEPDCLVLESSPDLFIKEVTVCQVVEDVGMLVAAKPFAVKVVVGCAAKTQQEVRLQLEWNGSIMDKFYCYSENNIDSDLKLIQDSRTLSFANQLEWRVYFFPSELPHADRNLAASNLVTVTVTIDPDNLLGESSELNNQMSRILPVVVPTWNDDPKDPNPELLSVWHLIHPRTVQTFKSDPLLKSWLTRYVTLCEQAADMLPVSYLNYDWNLKSYGLSLSKYGTNSKAVYAILKLANPFLKRAVIISPLILKPDFRSLQEWEQQYVRMHFYGPGKSRVVISYDPSIPTSYCNGVAATALSYGAIASVFQEWVNGGIEVKELMEGGIDVKNLRLLDDDLAYTKTSTRVSSVMGVGESVWDALPWLDKANYLRVLNQAANRAKTALSIQAAAENGLAIVSGTVFRNGSGQLDPVIRLGSGAADVSEPGPYQVSLLDAQNQPLASQTFGVDFVELGPEGLMETGEKSFAVALRWIPGASSVVLSRDGTLLASVQASAQAPTVEVLSPNGGENWSGLHSVRWQADDKDGDPLFFTILYSHDLGKTWEVLAINVPGREWEWDTSESAGAEETGLIKIVATDGFHCSEDSSQGPFSVSSKPPLAWIDQPLPDAWYQTGAEIVFTGFAFDVNLGKLPENAYRWSVEPGGLLGLGRVIRTNLLAGDYRVTQSVVSSNGLTVTNQVTIHVGSTILPDLNLEPGWVRVPSAPEVGRSYSLCTYIGNRGSSTEAEVHFFDGANLIHAVTNRVAAQDLTPVNAAWSPGDAGSHIIRVRVRDCSGLEQAIANNEVQQEVIVTSGDQDQDGLPDWWETLFFGQPTAAMPGSDADADGQTNLEEYRARTVPTDASSCFRLKSVRWNPDRQPVLEWTSVPGMVYQVEQTADLTKPFMPLTTGLEATDTEMTYTLAPQNASGQFYRLRIAGIVSGR